MAGESSEAQKKPPLSCTSCRARKLKCDKQDPCRHCARSGTECVFPTRKRIQRPRKTKNTELLQRLSRLESIVGRVGLVIPEETEAEAEAETEGAAPVGDIAVADAPAPPSQLQPIAVEPVEPRPHGGGNDVVSCSPQNVRPPRDSTVSRYMSAEFWSSLCDEVGGLRQALEQTTDSDDEDDNDEGATPESAGGSSGISASQGMLLGNIQTSGPRVMQHPSPKHIRYLAAVYFRNVDMHLKILHRPTILNALHDLADHPESASDLSPELTALFFAIYYAAITSLSPTECTRVLGRPRADLATLFQAGIEQALTRADYLNNTSLEPLQALTLYVCCLRSHNGSRASWALMGVPIRLAQALNLHQDGEGEGDSEGNSNTPQFSPFEAEQRRRLWWQLMVLDIRAAEDRGTGTIIARGSYDTRLPHNLDDDEFGPDTTTPLRDRTGPSDITFGLFTAQSSGMTLWSSHAPHDAGSRDETIRRVRQLEAQFVKGADPAHFGSYISSVIVRIIVLRVWLGMRYPLRPRGGDGLGEKLKAAAIEGQKRAGAGDAAHLTHLSAAHTATTPIPTTSGGGAFVFPPAPPEATALARRSTLRTAVSIMELTDFLETGPHSERTGWWCESYVQWHALAVALVELCTQTRGDTVERAWQVIETVFPRWGEKIADTKRGNLWRPIRKLYKKAKAAREAALSAERAAANQPPVRTQQQLTPGTQQQHGIPEPGTQYMAIDPALTTDSIGGLRPRLITDMILSESSAHTFSSGSPMPYTKYTKLSPDPNPLVHTTNLSCPKDQDTPLTTTTTTSSPALVSHLHKTRTSDPTANPTTPSDLDALLANAGGQPMAQAWLAWPDVNFDLPAAFPATITSQGGVPPPPPPLTTTIPNTNTNINMHNSMDAVTGIILGDPTLLESNMMDWSTWDEFVLDTYADSTPNSGSGGSEGN